MRNSEIKRKTAETDIRLALDLDGKGNSAVNSGCGFLDHMLTLFAKHSLFDLELECTGDIYVDYHHTVEDIGIVLGKAFKEALGDMKGIKRYGYAVIPMDEALILTATDICGRDTLCYGLDMPTQKVGDFDTELVREFLLGFVRNAEISLHMRQLSGDNSHHIIEGAFKSLARSLREAVSTDEKAKGEIPSTKGVIG